MDTPKYIERANGKLVVEVLEKLAVPVTLTTIVESVVEQTHGDPVQVVKSVRHTLAKGLAYGFVEALQRKYYLTCNPPWQYQDDLIRAPAIDVDVNERCPLEPSPPPTKLRRSKRVMAKKLIPLKRNTTKKTKRK